MRRWLPWILLAFVGIGFWLTNAALPGASPAGPANPVAMEGAVSAPETRTAQSRLGLQDDLPPEARHTIALVHEGGPFPYRQDGAVFGNREGRLPRQARGWYREYTVDTPGLGHRGARRIVTGGTPPAQWYYTDDHYESFRRFDPDAR